MPFYSLAHEDTQEVLLVVVPYDYPVLLFMSSIVSDSAHLQRAQTLRRFQAGAIAAGNAVRFETWELLPGTSPP
jgi:hypothetical protein